MTHAPATGECPGYCRCWPVLPKRQEAFHRQLVSAFVSTRQLAMDGGLDVILILLGGLTQGLGRRLWVRAHFLWRAQAGTTLLRWRGGQDCSQGGKWGGPHRSCTPAARIHAGPSGGLLEGKGPDRCWGCSYK